MPVSQSVIALEAHILFGEHLYLLHVQLFHHDEELFEHVFAVEFLDVAAQNRMCVVHSAQLS